MRFLRRPVALTAVLLVIVALAGCGQSSTSSTPLASGNTFTRLHAVRDNGSETSLPTFDHTGSDATAIGQLYSTIVALKPFPSGPIVCPADSGVLYHLTFTRSDGTQVAGEAKPDGCQYASVNGGTRGQIADENGFWTLFATAVGVQASALDLTS